ncbi:MAG: hypothetical protein NXY57DRAFT_962977 [Lentinula lateritia]|nr:MAG: hypothetical protein NXY57DRAFT_962977 [Lentinula lateritia]
MSKQSDSTNVYHFGEPTSPKHSRAPQVLHQLRDLDLANVEAIPYIKLCIASPLPPPMLEDWTYTPSGALTLELPTSMIYHDLVLSILSTTTLPVSLPHFSLQLLFSREVIYISSVPLLKIVKDGCAGAPMEVMGLMLNEFVDEYIIQVIDIFAMSQSGTTVEGGSDYRCVVLVLHPPHVPGSELPILLEIGHLIRADSSHRLAGSFQQFVPPNEVEDFSRSRIKTPPVQQVTFSGAIAPLPSFPSLFCSNDHLKTEVEELRTLLAQSRARTLKPVVGCWRRPQRTVLIINELFWTIKKELPEPPSEDLLTHFCIAHPEVDIYRKVAKHQKQELVELCKQDDTTSPSYDAYTKLNSTNTQALHQQDPLEELEEMVCQYQNRAHVAEGLIRQYPEDEVLYELKLPSLLELQRKLDASEYIGDLLEAITLLLYRGLHHTPKRLSSVVNFVLGYLSQAHFNHGELYLRSTSSLLYYYSNATDRVKGLYQEMLTHSHFPSHDAFLTTAQHAGYVDACPGSLEPPLHNRVFSFDHPILIPSSPTSNYLRVVPALDSIMISVRPGSELVLGQFLRQQDEDHTQLIAIEIRNAMSGLAIPGPSRSVSDRPRNLKRRWVIENNEEEEQEEKEEKKIVEGEKDGEGEEEVEKEEKGEAPAPKKTKTVASEKGKDKEVE